jgi:hypothetical protein
MGAFSSWVDGNWFNVIQTVGIIGSLWVAAAAANRESRTKGIENLLSLSEHHRELWKEIPGQDELARIFQPDADTLLIPVTLAEGEFLNGMVHSEGWRLHDSGGNESRCSELLHPPLASRSLGKDQAKSEQRICQVRRKVNQSVASAKL